MDKDKFLSMLTRADNGCLEWTGYTMPKPGLPYGRARFLGKKQLTHRIAYMLEFGTIPEGMGVLHRCDNPKCCDPAHLFLGTQTENIKDRDTKGRCRAKWSVRVGSDAAASKLTENDVIEIRRLRSCGLTTVELSKRYSVCTSGISRICNRKIWKHI